eukprot:TRINITY_DN4583_c0_g2_i2.p1 TRINITY_DN4583_c0_g2~~TRINITY_DN4583_c0_g2_i2.p1  ORF type:complete len:1368 (+),score=254.80 TRINITY_DN4583_c0_g2_i2:101-4204(+)
MPGARRASLAGGAVPDGVAGVGSPLGMAGMRSMRRRRSSASSASAPPPEPPAAAAPPLPSRHMRLAGAAVAAFAFGALWAGEGRVHTPCSGPEAAAESGLWGAARWVVTWAVRLGCVAAAAAAGYFRGGTQAKRAATAATAAAERLRAARRAAAVGQRGEGDAVAEAAYRAAVQQLKDDYYQHLLPVEGGEPSEWFSALMAQMWPAIAQYVHSMLTDYVEPMLQESVPGLGKHLRFTHSTLGSRPPQIGPLRHSIVKGGIELAVGFTYLSDADIRLQAGSVCSVGISDVQLIGTLAIILRPMLPRAPFLGGCEIVFINPPQLEMDFRGAANIADVAGVSGYVRSAVMQAIGSVCVFPNRVGVPFAWNDPDVPPERVKYPPGEGVLRVTVLSAKGLRASDISIGTLSKSSDPYVEVRVGCQVLRTAVEKGTVNPKWSRRNVLDFVVYSQQQWVQFDLWDWDSVGSDDWLGRVHFNTVRELRDLGARAGVIPLPVRDGSGTLSVQVEWRDWADPGEELDAAKFGAGKTGRSTSLLSVSLSEVTGLPAQGSWAPVRVRVQVQGLPRGEAKEDEWEERSQPYKCDQTSIAGWPKWDGYPDDNYKKIVGAIDLALTTSEGADTGAKFMASVAANIAPAGIDPALLEPGRRVAEEREIDALDPHLDQDERQVAEENIRRRAARWRKELLESYELHKQAANPQFEQVIHVLLPDHWQSIRLSLVAADDARELGYCTIPMGAVSGSQGGVTTRIRASAAESRAGDAAELCIERPAATHGIPFKGPFPIGVPSLDRTVQLHASVVLQRHKGDGALGGAGRSAAVIGSFQRRRSSSIPKICQTCGKHPRLSSLLPCAICQAHFCKNCSAELPEKDRHAGRGQARACRGCYVGSKLPVNSERLVITVVEAKRLRKADFGPFRSSDPFATISYSGYCRQTAVRTNTLDPKWGESYCFPAQRGQLVTVDVHDYDFGCSPDFLGTVCFDPIATLSEHAGPDPALGGRSGSAVGPRRSDGWFALGEKDAREAAKKSRRLGCVRLVVELLPKGTPWDPPQAGDALLLSPLSASVTPQRYAAKLGSGLTAAAMSSDGELHIAVLDGRELCRGRAMSDAQAHVAYEGHLLGRSPPPRSSADSPVQWFRLEYVHGATAVLDIRERALIGRGHFLGRVRIDPEDTVGEEWLELQPRANREQDRDMLARHGRRYLGMVLVSVRLVPCSADSALAASLAASRSAEGATPLPSALSLQRGGSGASWSASTGSPAPAVAATQSGLLQKRGRMGSWHQRYFEVLGNKLCYAEAAGAPPKQVITLTGAGVSTVPGHSGRFTITGRNLGRHALELEAHSQGDRDTWVVALRAAASLPRSPQPSPGLVPVRTPPS